MRDVPSSSRAATRVAPVCPLDRRHSSSRRIPAASPRGPSRPNRTLLVFTSERYVDESTPCGVRHQSSRGQCGHTQPPAAPSSRPDVRHGSSVRSVPDRMSAGRQRTVVRTDCRQAGETPIASSDDLMTDRLMTEEGHGRTRRFAITAIDWYQQLRAGRLSPCRFTPSCSSYAREAYDVHGVRRGSWLTVRRLVRCRPLGPSGFDPVPELDRRERGVDDHLPHLFPVAVGDDPSVHKDC